MLLDLTGIDVNGWKSGVYMYRGNCEEKRCRSFGNIEKALSHLYWLELSVVFRRLAI